MTVTYIDRVHTADQFGTFFRLLALWRGSILKGVGNDLILYCLFYTIISIAYRIGFSQDEQAKQSFELLSVFITKYQYYLPLDFILGFYVTQVVGHWWQQFSKIWWPDELAMDLAAYLPGSGYPRLVRREIVRLANLSSVMALRRLSSGIAKRFPTMQHFVFAGLMTEEELVYIEKMEKIVESKHQLTWVPISWAQATLRRARKDCPDLSSDFLYQTLHKDLYDVTDKCAGLISSNWVSLPLIYTQLVTLAVHIFFLSTLLSRQYLSPTQYIIEDGAYVIVPWGTVGSVNLVGYDNSTRDFYIPLFTLIQFVFYFAWLHVAEVLINPFGEDDEDFDLNYLIDRNIQISYLMVDGVEGADELQSDPYVGQIPMALPHTVESFKTVDPHPGNITDHIIENLTVEDMELMEEEDQDGPLIFINSTESLGSGEMETPAIQTMVRRTSRSSQNTPQNRSPCQTRIRYTTLQ